MRQKKTILIPIDFSIESLNTLKLALEENKSESVSVVLVYTEHLTNSISELLFYSSQKIIQSYTSPQFNDAINIIKNTYESTLQSLRIELFHGCNKNALRNFLEALQIDHIYLPKTYRLKLKKNGFDPIPIIKKITTNYKEVSWHSDDKTSTVNQLQLLFNK
jgi:hypothetical protein